MKIYENRQYMEDVIAVLQQGLPWEKLKNKTVLISGGSGLVGSFLVDVLMLANKEYELECHVIVIGRNEEKAKLRFSYYWDNENFKFISTDISKKIDSNLLGDISYIIHLASNTHPVAYATDPIGTITTNVFGTYMLLELAAEKNAERFVFASSNEIYGENRGDVELFDEQYCGYIDCNTLRAGYPESKRCSEALCQAYYSQKGIDVVIPRLTRSYGPTMLMNDTKALSQFLINGLKGENIVLKSEGLQYYSYTYVADAVYGLLTVMLIGESGECYNISDESSDIRLKDLAEIIAEKSNTKVVFELPDDIEKKGYSTATKARLDSKKIKELGWHPLFDINSGIARTLDILREI